MAGPPIAGLGARRVTAIVAGEALGLAPACHALAQVLLLPAMPGSGLWAVSHLALFAWAFFLVLAVFGLGWQLWSRGLGYAVAGGVLVVFGALVDTFFTGLDLVSGVMAGSADRLVMERLSEAIFTQLILPLDTLDDTLPVGLLILAIGLYRTRAGPCGR